MHLKSAVTRDYFSQYTTGLEVNRDNNAG